MILRSVMKHVKDQNWVAVFLDFFIVVVGILLAFQITNWNERQVSKKAADRLLATLNIDLQAMRERVFEQNQRSYQITVTLDALLAQLETGDTLDRQTVVTTINKSQNMYFIVEPPLSFREMMTSGKLDLLQSAALRASLRQYFGLSSINLHANTYLADEFSHASGKLNRFFVYKRAPSSVVDRDFIPIIDVDIQALWSDPEARFALKSTYNIHVNMQYLTQTIIDSIDVILDEMESGGIQ